MYFLFIFLDTVSNRITEVVCLHNICRRRAELRTWIEELVYRACSWMGGSLGVI